MRCVTDVIFTTLITNQLFLQEVICATVRVAVTDLLDVVLGFNTFTIVFSGFRRKRTETIIVLVKVNLSL